MVVENIKNNLLFVYGSLLSGHQNNYILSSNPSTSYIGKAKTSDTYSMIGLKSGAYPYITKSVEYINKTNIIGELYTVSDESIAFLDKLEGHPTQYIRKECDVIDENNKKVVVNMYILENKDILKDIYHNFQKRFLYIDSGNWDMYKIDCGKKRNALSKNTTDLPNVSPCF